MIEQSEHPRHSRPRIGELLWRRGACDLEALRRAWELKVIYGDRLGTNLLAEGLIEEKDLALALGEQHGVHAAYGELIRVNPRVARLLKPPVADRHNICPHHVEENRIYLLMTDPHNVEAIDLVYKGTGLTVVPVVVCEARMWALLLEHYGISRGLRPIALDGDPFLAAQKRLKAHEEQKKRAASGPELQSEEEFNALYMQHAFGEAKADEPPVVAGQVVAEHAMAPQGVAEPDVTPVIAGQPLTEEAAPIELIPVGSDEGDESGLLELQPIPVDVPVAPAPVEQPPLTPLTFEEATERLRGVHDRDEIARVVLRYALTRFRRAALLTVHPHGVFGWEALGDLPRDAVRAFRLPKGERSVFGLVVDSRSHYMGPLQTWTANGSWVKTTGRQLPRSVAVMPIFVRGRVVNLLYGDNGHGEHVESDIGELLILAQRIADSYEALLKAPVAFGAPST